jgi:hypothetical protein
MLCGLQALRPEKAFGSFGHERTKKILKVGHFHHF